MLSERGLHLATQRFQSVFLYLHNTHTHTRMHAHTHAHTLYTTRVTMLISMQNECIVYIIGALIAHIRGDVYVQNYYVAEYMQLTHSPTVTH